MKISDELISIVVPIYKVPTKYLKNNIENLMNQTYKNIEIILVDDGSPDDCGKICEFYAEKDKRFKVIHQKNKGLSGARNTGFLSATGSWIMFVDGDDFIELNACEKLSELINDKIDVIYFQAYRVVGDLKSKIYNRNCDFKELEYSSVESLNYFKKMTLNYNAHISTAWGKLYRYNFLKDNNILHDEILKQGAEGIEFCIHLLNKKPKLKYSNLFLYNYIYNNESISSYSSNDNNYFVLKCFNKIKNEIDIDDNELIFWFYNRMNYVIITSIVNGYFSPRNKENFSDQISDTKKYLSESLVYETLSKGNYDYLDFKRKVLLFFIKRRMWLLLKIVQKLRKIRIVK